MTPATSPGGRGPSLSNNPNTSTGHWFDIFGPVLSVHDGHGYSTWDRFVHTGRALPTGDILRGRTSIGVYFCADWCGPCKAFTPILKTYYEAQRASRLRNVESTLEIVLVSRCRTWQESEALFSTMPWTAMSHLDSTGARGNDLMTKFGVTTIPALVLLDGTGAITCQDGRAEVVRQQAAVGRAGGATVGGRPRADITAATPATPKAQPPAEGGTAASPRAGPRAGSPRLPVRDCDMPLAVRRPPLDRAMPPHPRNDPRRSARPRGRPPTFPAAGEPDLAGVGSSELGRPAPVPRPPQRSPKKRPPPKPNLIIGDPSPAHHRVQFAPSPSPTSETAHRPSPPSNRTTYKPTAAQLAMVAAAAAAGASGSPQEPSPATNPFQGKPRSLMQPQPLADIHPFTPIMKEWRNGIAVDCGPDWSWDVIEAAIARGPHPTARTPEAIALFKDDIEYQVNAGFSTVMLWDDVRRLRPSNLKISPVALIPQVGRRGRIILDLSFPVYQDVHGVVTVTQESVNNTTVLTAPAVPVKEIGKVLPRLLQYMRDTPVGLHILFSKLDISDGFWRLVVRDEDAFNFAYVLPQEAGEPCRLVVPAAVQMGWVESPSLFCTVTESARDLAQHFVDTVAELPHDEVEDKMRIADVPLRARTEHPTKLLQVYVDDFCLAGTQSTDGTHIPRIRRAAVQGIQALFPTPNITKHTGGKEPISRKKIDQGDGNFVTLKEMIGVEFDGVRRTVRLPAAKAKAYIKATHTILRRKTVPLKALQMLVGKLRHASIILPAAKGFFTPVNSAMRGSPKLIGLGANSELRAALEDIISLLKILSSRPTHVNELVASMPHFAGYHDAAAEGAGGVWFSLAEPMQPCVWRDKFPSDIASDVISDDNPNGSLTNSDLELAAEVLAVGVILDRGPCVKHAPIGTLCDNTPTVSWVEKMASKAKTPTAGRLLRGLAYMLHCQHAGRLTTVHVPGTDNVMADIASRPSKAMSIFRASSALSDTAFCSAFDSAFPLPDDQPWALAFTPPWVKSNVFETLRGKRLKLPQWMGPNATAGGKRGQSTTRSSMGSPTHPTKHRTQTDSSRLLLPCGKEGTALEIRSRFNLSKGLSGTSHKSMFWTDVQTPDEHHPPSNPSISPSLV